MSLACPSCGRTIAIKDARPGRFEVPCPECGQPFRLEVGADGEPLVARAIEEEAPPASDARRIADLVLAALRERAGWAWRAVIGRRSSVGGAVILRDLGRTSLGAIGRGRQVLVGRDVLVRTLPADWGGPSPVARARAYELGVISSEIDHPNLLRRLEFGDDRGRRFAIEEAVEGTTLASLAARDDWPGGDAALPPILHAARGLLAAHEQGLAHGDPSAEHIWLDDGGVVKLAGLGLRMAPGADTRDGAEPFSLSAARDVQSLGQMLDALAQPGKPGGSTGSPKVREVVGRMRAAGTVDGYRDLAEAVAAMESALGPATGDDGRWAEIVARHHDVPLASLRSKLAAGFAGVCSLFALLFLFGGRFLAAAFVIGLGGLTAVIYALLRAGMARRSGLFGRVRELILGGGRADWLTVLSVVLGTVVVVWAVGWLGAGIGLLILATLVAVGFLVALDVPIDRERDASLAEARALLAAMRSRGVSERAIREFACRTGERWDEVFEAVFGLDETRLALVAHPRRFRLADLRFPILDWLDARLRDRRMARDRDLFEPVEESALVSQKINEMTARRKSRRISEALVIVCREVRASVLAMHAPASSGAIRVTPRPVPDLIREAVETPDKLLATVGTDDRDAERGPNPLLRLPAMLTGPRARFLLGGLLCALFLLWADKVGIISSTEIREKAERAIAERDVGHLKDVNVDVARIQIDEPLDIPGVPRSLTRLVSGYGVGAAGLILIASALVAGSRIAVFAIPAAAIAWLGPKLGIPAIGPLAPAAVAAAIGAGVLVVGMLWTGRR